MELFEQILELWIFAAIIYYVNPLNNELNPGSRNNPYNYCNVLLRTVTARIYRTAVTTDKEELQFLCNLKAEEALESIGIHSNSILQVNRLDANPLTDMLVKTVPLSVAGILLGRLLIYVCGGNS